MTLSVVLLLLLSTNELHANNLPKCLFLNSYHKGYDWSDGVEAAVYENLKGVCEVTSFYLNAKKEPQKESVKAKALEAKSLIEQLQPRVVIGSDDNVSDEIIVPFFKDAKTPFVFCGINWNTKKHGYPFSNATGMVEVTPVQPLIKEAKKIFKKIKTATFLAGDVEADRENYEIFKEIYTKEGVDLRPLLVKSMDEWEAGYKKAQETDLVLIVNNAGVKGWDHERVKTAVLTSTIKPSITSHEYMVKYSMLSFTKIAAEQGEWAAHVAKEIIKGTPISKIPVVINRKWNIFVNEDLLKKIKATLPKPLKNRASLVQL